MVPAFHHCFDAGPPQQDGDLLAYLVVDLDDHWVVRSLDLVVHQ
jgi:hypothetical protein